MRRWTITLLLSMAALAALVAAPRLVAHIAPVEVSPISDPTAPPSAAPPVVVEHAASAVIPELSEPRVVPIVVPIAVPIADVPDSFWLDVPDCGMG